MASATERSRHEVEHVVYIGCRPFAPLEPANSDAAFILTLEGIDQIRNESLGSLSLRLMHSNFDSNDVVASLTVDAGLINFTRSDAALSGIKNLTAAVDIVLNVDSRQAIDFLCDRRDADLSASHAYVNRSVHWGTQNWGGLRIEFRRGDQVIARSMVDAFCTDDADDLSGELRIFGLCENPLRERGFDDSHQPNDFRAPAAKQHDDKQVAGPELRCRKCGARIDVGPLLDLAYPTESILLIGCGVCLARYSIRVLRPDEANRVGYSLVVESVINDAAT